MRCCWFINETVLTSRLSCLSTQQSLVRLPEFVWGQNVPQKKKQKTSVFSRDKLLKEVDKGLYKMQTVVYKPDSTFGKASNTGDWATPLQIQFGPRQYVKYKPSSSCGILIYLKNVVDRKPSLSAGAMNNENVDFPFIFFICGKRECHPKTELQNIRFKIIIKHLKFLLSADWNQTELHIRKTLLTVNPFSSDCILISYWPRRSPFKITWTASSSTAGATGSVVFVLRIHATSHFPVLKKCCLSVFWHQSALKFDQPSCSSWL